MLPGEMPPKECRYVVAGFGHGMSWLAHTLSLIDIEVKKYQHITHFWDRKMVRLIIGRIIQAYPIIIQGYCEEAANFCPLVKPASFSLPRPLFAPFLPLRLPSIMKSHFFSMGAGHRALISSLEPNHYFMN